MNDEIKEILNNADSSTKFKMVDEDGTEKEMNIAGLIEQLLNDNKNLLDYITNLQYKYENQIHRYKNLKNYTTNLQEENERLKANYKNDKSHQVNFDYFQLLYNKYSKDTIIDDLVYKCEDLYNLKKSYDKAIIKYGDYKSRNEKAIEHIKEHQLIYTSQYEEESNFDNHLLDILNGDDE
jgi:hypothetical protein